MKELIKLLKLNGLVENEDAFEEINLDDKSSFKINNLTYLKRNGVEEQYIFVDASLKDNFDVEEIIDFLSFELKFKKEFTYQFTDKNTIAYLCLSSNDISLEQIKKIEENLYKKIKYVIIADNLFNRNCDFISSRIEEGEKFNPIYDKKINESSILNFLKLPIIQQVNDLSSKEMEDNAVDKIKRLVKINLDECDLTSDIAADRHKIISKILSYFAGKPIDILEACINYNSEMIIHEGLNYIERKSCYNVYVLLLSILFDEFDENIIDFSFFKESDIHFLVNFIKKFNKNVSIINFDLFSSNLYFKYKLIKNNIKVK